MLLTTKPAIVSILLLIFITHVVGLSFKWYHQLWWVDIVMHAVGGVWVAAVFFLAQERYAPGLTAAVPRWFFILVIIGVVMMVGVWWEWFEYVFDAFFVPSKFQVRVQLGLGDTMGDLLADFIGGWVFAWYGARKRYEKNK